MKHLSIEKLFTPVFLIFIGLFAYQIFIFEYSVNAEHYALEYNEKFGWAAILTGFFIYGLITIISLRWRIRQLEKSTQRFSSGNLDSRADESAWKTIGTLNHSFNVMADNISTLIENNRQLTRSVAHELRTPLFKIQWQAEVLSETALDDEQKSAVDSIIEDTEEMTELVNELLYYAKLNHHTVEFDFSPIDCAIILKEYIEYWQHETNKSITLSLSSSPLNIVCDKKQFKRALNNLVRNAIRYAQKEVQISVIKDHKTLSIQINDDGQGIAECHWENIFTPFYSTDPARNKSTSGHGLGLAIVKEIIDKHNGSIMVSKSALGGASFTLSFPLCNLE